MSPDVTTAGVLAFMTSQETVASLLRDMTEPSYPQVMPRTVIYVKEGGTHRHTYMGMQARYTGTHGHTCGTSMAHMWIHTGTHVRTCVCTNVYACMDTCTLMCVSALHAQDTHVHVGTQTHIYARTPGHTHIHTGARACTPHVHTRAHMDTHTRSHTRIAVPWNILGVRVVGP